MVTERPLGERVAWAPRSAPEPVALEGEAVRLEPLDAARHGDDLWEAAQGPDVDPGLWTYMPVGPWESRGDFDAWLEGVARSEDPLFVAVVDRGTGRAVGMASYLRITPLHGTIEIGHIYWGPALRRTRGATEAVYLLARRAFDELGYRRLEWKCDSLNGPSRRAAERLGFSYEGTFRQHMVVKGRNRDTAWYAMTDRDWPEIRAAFEAWLADENFDEEGRQRRGLEELRG